MALRVIEGFDDLDTTHMFGRLIGISNTQWQQIDTVHRIAGRSLLMYNHSNWVTFAGLNSQSGWVAGFGYSFATALGPGNQIVRFLDSGAGAQLELRLTAAGKLVLTRNGTPVTGMTGTTVLAVNVWYHIQVKVKFVASTLAGDCEIRLNSISECSIGAGVNTNLAGTGTADQVQFGNDGSSDWTHHYDDLYLCDLTGGAPCNGFLGDCQVALLSPTGAGATSAWTPSAGSNWQNVDEVPGNDDTDYNSTAGTGNTDTYAMADLLTSPASLYGVAINVLARKDASGARTVAPVVRMGGTDYPQTAQALGTGYSYIGALMPVRPSDSAAWTATDINAMEAGMKLVS